MTKWQYAVLQNDGGELSLHGPNGGAQKLDSTDTVVTLNQLGMNGWELVHIATTNAIFYNNFTASTLNRYYYLKRPIS
jgi:hypothetical protein